MLAVERRNRIEQIINKNKSVLVVELAKQFEVTTETIRGDLEKLEKQDNKAGYIKQLIRNDISKNGY